MELLCSDEYHLKIPSDSEEQRGEGEEPIRHAIKVEHG